MYAIFIIIILSYCINLFHCVLCFKAHLLPLGLGDEFWRDVVENPDKWWDNRSNKVTLVSELFVCLLLLLDVIFFLMVYIMLYWILFTGFMVPFDYQRNKRAPDFKHKETGEVLWLDGSPSWVLSKLPPLKP